MTLYGPSEAKSLDDVANRIKAVARDYQLIKIKTSAIDYFDNVDKKWIVVRVKPNQKLESLRSKIYQSLSKISDPQPWDKDATYKFHFSLGKTDRGYVFNRLRRIANNWSVPELEQFLLRICIINGQGKIHKEYDLLLGRLLTRNEALSPRINKETLIELRRLLKGSGPRVQQFPPPNPIMAFIKKLFS